MIPADEMMKVVGERGFCGGSLKLRHTYRSFDTCMYFIYFFSDTATLQSSPDRISFLYSTSIHNLCFLIRYGGKKILEVTFQLERLQTFFLFLKFFFQEKFIEEVQAGESGIVRKTS